MIACKQCGSKAVVKYGRYRQVQRYWCKSCQRKFKADGTAFHMKTSSAEISRSLDLYFGGLGVEEIRKVLRDEFGRGPAKRSLFRWIEKYSRSAMEACREYRPENIGDTWIADETVIHIGGQKVWIFDIQDEKTRFWLATQITPSRTAGGTHKFLEEAYQKAGTAPGTVVTDSYISYLIESENISAAADWQVPDGRFAMETDTQRIDLFHSTLRDRTTVLKRLKSLEAAGRFNAAWRVYYNFFRPNESAGGNTPAEQAGMSCPCRRWEDVVLCSISSSRSPLTPPRQSKNKI
jgi:putative transposase